MNKFKSLLLILSLVCVANISAMKTKIGNFTNRVATELMKKGFFKVENVDFDKILVQKWNFLQGSKNINQLAKEVAQEIIEGKFRKKKKKVYKPSISGKKYSDLQKVMYLSKQEYKKKQQEKKKLYNDLMQKTIKLSMQEQSKKKKKKKKKNIGSKKYENMIIKETSEGITIIITNPEKTEEHPQEGSQEGSGDEEDDPGFLNLIGK
ncbi:hypothetical protein ACFLYU_04115 [Candidatus Dependentiae bacterium]